MPSLLIGDLTGEFSATDYGARFDGSHNDGLPLSLAMLQLSSLSVPNGKLIMPPGNGRVATSIAGQSNIALVGSGRATVLTLGINAYVDVLVLEGLHNIRLRDFKIDGNRTNNLLGTRHGIWLYQCSDILIDDIEVVSCVADGIALNDCERVTIGKGVRTSDNGRHGISLTYCRACQVNVPACYNNCQLVTAGDGDGINLGLLSEGNQIVGPVCYETAMAGDRQGYGIREAAAENVGRTYILGGYLQGNKTGTYSLESSDSTKA